MQLLWKFSLGSAWKIVKEVFNGFVLRFVPKMWESAMDICRELDASDLTSSEKRQAAFNKIKKAAVKEGLEIKDFAINLIIELAVAAIKQRS